MGAETGISWADKTFNGWIGCVKVSPACVNCYAERERFVNVKRGEGVELWGADAARHRTSEAYWRQPIAWNKEAQAAGKRSNVFAFSLADVFEDRRDLDPWRADFFELIERTPWLIWMLLTKRWQARLIRRLTPARWWGLEFPGPSGWPANVALGTTGEDQPWAMRRLRGEGNEPGILFVPAKCHWLSAEPLLGEINVSELLLTGRPHYPLRYVIAGGESGTGARPMNPKWARSLRNQCREAGAGYHLKQWGEWAPDCHCQPAPPCRPTIARPGETDGSIMFRCGKKRAGHLLDGREHQDMLVMP